jgi:hypothetical protein
MTRRTPIIGKVSPRSACVEGRRGPRLPQGVSAVPFRGRLSRAVAPLAGARVSGPAIYLPSFLAQEANFSPLVRLLLLQVKTSFDLCSEFG